MADDLATTPLAEDPLDELVARVRGANQSSPELREDVNRAVGLYLKRQPEGQASVDHTAELTELLGSQWAAEIRAAQANYLSQRAQFCTDGPERGKNVEGDPVMMFNGQFVHTVTDLHINGAGMDFAFVRTYKNQAYARGPLGVNWDHCWNLWLRVEGTSLVRSSGELREDRYRLHETRGYWVPPAGYHDTIEADGDSYVSTTPARTRFLYERDSADRHRIRRIVDRNDNYLAFGYDAAGRLARVQVNAPDRWVAFGYDAADRITSMRTHRVTYVDDKGAARMVARTWTYAYDDFGDLVSVTTPGTSDHGAGLTTRYEHSSPYRSGESAHNLVRIWDPAGNLYLENRYGEEPGLLTHNRVVRQRQNLGEYAFEYDSVQPESTWVDPWGYRPEELPAFRTVLVQRNGHPVEHVYNRLGNLIVWREVVVDGCERQELISRFRYNADGAPVASLSPEGRLAQFSYGREDFYGRPFSPGDSTVDPWQDGNLTAAARRAFGNTLATLRRGDLFTPVMFDLGRGLYGDIFPSSRAADPSDVIVKSAYEPYANQLSTVSDPRHTASADPRHPESDAYRRHLTHYEYSPAPRANLLRVHLPDTTFPLPLPDGTTRLVGTVVECLAYDARGRLRLSRDEEGHTTRRVYFSGGTRDGYVRREVRDDGGMALRTTYRVNEVGSVTVRINPRGARSYTRTNELGQVVETVSGLGFRMLNQYDRNGQLAAVERDNLDDTGQPSPDGPQTRTYCYDGSGNLLRETAGGKDPTARSVTRHRYDASDQRVETVLPAGNRVRATYDQRLLPRTRTRGAGSPVAATTRADHDGDGHRTLDVDGRGYVARTRYDALGRVTSVVDALGGLRQFGYDKGGRRTVERFFVPRSDGAHDLLSRSTWRYDERGSQVRSTAWAFRQPVRTADPNAGPDAEFDAAVQAGLVERLDTYSFYDRARRLIRVVDPGGNATEYDYDGADRLVAQRDALGNMTRTAYDANGNAIRVDRTELLRDPATGAVTGAEVFSTLSTYDAMDRQTRVTDGLGNTTALRYDSLGNLTSVTDPLGNLKRNRYDVHGRRTRIIVEMTDTGLGGGARLADVVTASFYDDNGNLSEVRDPAGNSTRFYHDALDRQYRVTRADGSHADTEYDQADNVIGLVDENGLRVVNQVDPLGRIVRVDLDLTGLRQEFPYPQGAETFEACTFDGLGRLVRQSNDVCEIEVRYDSVGRPYREGLRLTGQPPGPLVLEREFDAVANRIRLRYPNGRDVRWHYDGLHRLTRVEQRTAGAGYPGSATWPAAYDIARYSHHGLRLGRARFANAAGYTVRYDGVGRVIAVTHARPGGTLLSTQHLFDGAGNRRYRRDNPAPPGLPNGESYGYDSRYALASIRRQSIPAIDPADFAPPSQALPPGSLVGQRAIDAAIGPLTLNAQQVTWRYDAAGNRTEERPGGASPIFYTPNQRDQYITVGSAPYRYDRNGNVLTDGVRRYSYNYRNRLSIVEYAATGVEVLRLRYDPVGRLTVIEEGGVTTAMLHDGRNVVEEYRGGTLAVQYVNEDGPDRRVQAASGGVEWWYHTDVLRSTRLLSDATGAAVARYSYQPFGTPITPSAHPNRYTYVGKRQLAADLFDARARSYVPSLGRFLQRDPAGMVDGTNLYPYAANNPTSFIDPMGTDASSGVTLTEEPDLLAAPLTLEDRFELVNQQYDEALAGTSGEARKRVHDRYREELRLLRREAFREGHVRTAKFAAATYAVGVAGALGGLAGGAVGGAVAAEAGLGYVGTSLVVGGMSGLTGSAASESMQLFLGKPEISGEALLYGTVWGLAGGAVSSAYHYQQFPVQSTFLRGQPGVIGPGRYGWQYIIEEGGGVIGPPVGDKLSPDIPVAPGLHRAHYHGWFIGGGNKAFYSAPRVNTSYMKVFENAARSFAQGGNLQVTTMRGGGTTSLEWSAYPRTGQPMQLGLPNVLDQSVPRLAPTLRAAHTRVTPGTTIWIDD